MTGVEMLVSFGVDEETAQAAVAGWADSPLGGHDAVLAVLTEAVETHDVEAVCSGCGSFWTRSGLPNGRLRTGWWHFQTICWACGPHWDARPPARSEPEVVQLALDWTA